MLGRVVAGTIASIALLCASFAWAGWVYLHTIGDPHRTEEIANAILEDDAARREVSDALAGQLVERFGLPSETRPTVTTAVAAALDDPRIAANVIDALGAEHARALGVDDPRPTTIDTNALVVAAREHLAASAPSIAAVLDQASAGVDIPDLTLPDLHTETAGRLREIADSTTTTLGIIAVVLLGAAFAVGDRRHITRRFGTWAVFSGIGWLAGPYVVAAVAKQFTSDLDATIDVVREACQGPVIVGAIALVAAGSTALVLWLMPIWPATSGEARVGARRPSRGWEPQPVQRHDPGGGVPVAHGVPTTAMAATPPSRSAAPVDTFTWSGQPAQPHAGPSTAPYAGPYAAPTQPIPSPPPQTQGAPPDPWAPTVPETTDVDPWAVYFGPDQR